MCLDPLECLDLVAETHVEVAVGGVAERRGGKETQRGEAIVDGNDHDVCALINPMIERPVSWVTENVAYS